MNPPRTRRHALPLLAIGQWLLGLAVLVWGTSYKVSLYPVPGQNPERIPQAKLLSDEERPRDTQTRTIEATPPRPSVAFLCTAALIAFAAARPLFLPAILPLALRRRLSPTARLRSLTYFFFRPPPASSNLSFA